jgi:DNA-binding beta-propeller fold protein YncE
MMSLRSTLTALCLAAVLAGCAGAPIRQVGTVQADDPRFPRGEGRWIAYVGEVQVPEHLGIKHGFFKKVWRFITGAHNADALYRPFGVAVSDDGRLAVADPGRRLVHVYEPSAKKYRQLRGQGAQRLRYPVAAAYVGSTLYVADSELPGLVAFDPEGNSVPLLPGLPLFERPTGLALDKAGQRLIVVDAAAHRVYAVPLQGGAVTSVGGRGERPGEFNFPTHVTVDDAGKVYVCDAMNFRIQVFSPELKPVLQFGELGDSYGQFSKPKGLAVDREGNIFVVEGFFGLVQAFSPRGELLGAFGSEGVEAGAFWLPGGAVVDGRNRLYVADTFNSRVQVFDLDRRSP